MRVLCQKLDLGKVDTVLMQEPWIHENHIRQVPSSWGTICSVTPNG
jgi:hypothetical protein